MLYWLPLCQIQSYVYSWFQTGWTRRVEWYRIRTKNSYQKCLRENGDWVWEAQRLSVSQSGNPNRSLKTRESKRKVYQMEARKLTLEVEILRDWQPALRAISLGRVRREPKPECSQVCWVVIDVLSWKELFLHTVPKSLFDVSISITQNVRSSLY